MKTTFASLLTLALAGLLLLPASSVEARPTAGTAPSALFSKAKSKHGQSHSAFRKRIKHGKHDSMSRAVAQKHRRFVW